MEKAYIVTPAQIEKHYFIKKWYSDEDAALSTFLDALVL